MEGEAETSVASAHDAGGLSEAGPRRAEAGASIAGCGSLSASPAEEAVVSSADLVRWSRKVESEVRRVASWVEEVSGSLSFVLRGTMVPGTWYLVPGITFWCPVMYQPGVIF